MDKDKDNITAAQDAAIDACIASLHAADAPDASDYTPAEYTSRTVCGTTVAYGDRTVTYFCWRFKECSTCSKLRRNNIAASLSENIDIDNGNYAHLTLTVPSAYEGLRYRVDKLYDAAAKLRRRKVWTDHIQGGVQFLDMTYDPASQAIHLHLHITVELRQDTTLPLAEILASWLHLTEGDGHQRPLAPTEDDKNRLCGYLAQPIDLKKHAEVQRQYVTELKRKREAMPFGTFYGSFRVNPKRKPQPPILLDSIIVNLASPTAPDTT